MKLFALWLLQLYKRWISPALPPSCRYVPTCSEYAMEAVERYGALRGGVMAAWRLLRCHPLAKGGLDTVVKDPTHSHNSRLSGAPSFAGPRSCTHVS
jgi:putative membrane protein insertion efficiency factor